MQDTNFTTSSDSQPDNVVGIKPKRRKRRKAWLTEADRPTDFQEWPRWAREYRTPTGQRLRSRERAALREIASYADAEGYAWPCQETMAANTDMALSVLQLGISGLVWKGLIRVRRRTDQNGHRRGNYYEMVYHTTNPSPPKKKKKAKKAARKPQPQRKLALLAPLASDTGFTVESAHHTRMSGVSETSMPGVSEGVLHPYAGCQDNRMPGVEEPSQDGQEAKIQKNEEANDLTSRHRINKRTSNESTAFTKRGDEDAALRRVRHEEISPEVEEISSYCQIWCMAWC